MKYKHLFFDLDHTIWDFDRNSREALEDIYASLSLRDAGVHDFDVFHSNYLVHNERLWEKYRNGRIRVDELRWKRMWFALLDFKIGDEALATRTVDDSAAAYQDRRWPLIEQQPPRENRVAGIDR